MGRFEVTQLRLRFEIGKFGDDALIYFHGDHCRSGNGSSPSEWSSSASSPGSGFGVVSNFSPMKREFAPARSKARRLRAKANGVLRSGEPSRHGMSIRAVAIMRTKTNGSSGS